MNITTVIRATLRRWYVTVPGLLATVFLVIAAHTLVQPTFTRSADLLLIPAEATMPKGSNPYLYIGGLSQAADVLVTAASSQSVLGPVLEGHEKTTLTVSRDTSSSGPVLLITVETPSADQSGEILDGGIKAVTATLAKLQSEEHLTQAQMITASQLSVDTTATPKTKSQFMATAAAGGIGFVGTLILATFIDGLILSRPRRGARDPKRSTPGPRRLESASLDDEIDAREAAAEEDAEEDAELVDRASA
ncbi:hypothetical protein [Gryllotalpicola koreensis]|uniref:Polysaccharide chain length determinant N-terminal domain-containing protein n=1 Tax=Gryllotalpicola koreensis TaxID=993086 RepID=A0ABP7ZPD0_9MICO